MWGPPEYVEGQCNAHLYIGDDYGDGTATLQCQLTPRHTGPHSEEFTRDYPGEAGLVQIFWEFDERPKENE